VTVLNQRYFNLESIPARVLIALGELGRVERAVYVLHEIFRQPLEEIASALNMPEQAVRLVLEHSLARLEAARSA
jgi:DNA-directed RNA polymerase specialized sigma24 family protein